MDFSPRETNCFGPHHFCAVVAVAAAAAAALLQLLLAKLVRPDDRAVK